MNTDLTEDRGAVERRKEQLVSDVKSVVADAEGLVEDVAHSTAEGFVAARTRIEEKAGEARTRLDEAGAAVVERAKGAADVSREYVRENPWRVLAAAAVAGLVVGFLLRRR